MDYEDATLKDRLESCQILRDNPAPDARITVPQAWQEVRLIREGMYDAELAHIREKALWRLVLQTIATDVAPDSRALAEAALATETIEFPRWFA